MEKIKKWAIGATVDKIPDRKCLQPVIKKYDIDLSSTLPYYDEKGHPKQYAPSKRNAQGEWLYALSSYKNNPPLTGILLRLHLAEIDKLRQSALLERTLENGIV